MATNALYKVFNGESWEEYHLKTNAGQVNQTTGNGWRKFVSASVTVNGQAFGENGTGASVTLNGTHIVGSAAVSSGNLTYISSSDTISSALGKLDQAAKAAYDRTSTGYLTTANYADTLNSVYQAKDADLTAIAGLSGNSGLLKKTAENTWELDTTSYVPQTRTINTKQLNGDVVLYGTDIKVSSSIGAGTIASEITNLRSAVNGQTRGYGISNETPSNSRFRNTEFADSTNLSNYHFNITIPTIQMTGQEDALELVTGGSVDLGSLKVGDVIYVIETEVPDWWVSNVDVSISSGYTTITFSKLETQKVDLTTYATKATTLAGYGITDAYISGGTIYLGSNSITPLTSHQDISGKAPNNHASSDSTYGLGTTSAYGHIKLATGDMNGASNADGVACSKNHTHSQYLTVSTYNTDKALFTKVFTQSSEPSSGMKSGDILIQTT